ncbi:hypothetical protein [Cereibacter sphaeroides]|uniref:hypothetical protein n=1 Tax=Cereibacter sphaeroides TaxID=1063 RepID=UPI0015591F92|nr:hypothetical protein [Cereibacter sphaeroides]
MKKIKVTSAFVLSGGAIARPGQVVDVDAALAAEMVRRGKAEVAPDPAPAPVEAPAEPAPAEPTAAAEPAAPKGKAKAEKAAAPGEGA